MAIRVDFETHLESECTSRDRARVEMELTRFAVETLNRLGIATAVGEVGADRCDVLAEHQTTKNRAPGLQLRVLSSSGNGKCLHIQLTIEPLIFKLIPFQLRLAPIAAAGLQKKDFIDLRDSEHVERAVTFPECSECLVYAYTRRPVRIDCETGDMTLQPGNQTVCERFGIALADNDKDGHASYLAIAASRLYLDIERRQGSRIPPNLQIELQKFALETASLLKSRVAVFLATL